MSPRTTAAPSDAIRLAQPKPMPCAAPVTMTTLPESRLLIAANELVVCVATAAGGRAALGCVGANLRPIVDRILRALDRWHGMFLQVLQRNSNALFELRIFALAPECRIEFNFDVRLHAFVLDVEFPGRGIVAAPAWSCDSTAIHQVGIAADANESAPGTRANERANVQFLEHPRQRVAA